MKIEFAWETVNCVSHHDLGYRVFDKCDRLQLKDSVQIFSLSAQSDTRSAHINDGTGYRGYFLSDALLDSVKKTPCHAERLAERTL